MEFGIHNEEIEELFRKDANGTITDEESKVLVDWLEIYDKDWKVYTERRAYYKELKVKESRTSNH